MPKRYDLNDLIRQVQIKVVEVVQLRVRFCLPASNPSLFRSPACAFRAGCASREFLRFKAHQCLPDLRSRYVSPKCVEQVFPRCAFGIVTQVLAQLVGECAPSGAPECVISRIDNVTPNRSRGVNMPCRDYPRGLTTSVNKCKAQNLRASPRQERISLAMPLNDKLWVRG